MKILTESERARSALKEGEREGERRACVCGREREGECCHTLSQESDWFFVHNEIYFSLCETIAQVAA